MSTPAEREAHARGAMGKTSEELAMWVRARSPDDSYRQSIVKMELDRRVLAAQTKAAWWMPWSILIAFFATIVAAAAWLWPHT